MRVIRAFVRTEYEEERFAEANADLTDTALKVTRLFALAFPSLMLIMSLSSVAVIWFGGGLVDAGDMQIGNLLAFQQYIMQILFAVMMATMMLMMVPRASAASDRIQAVLLAAPEIGDPLRAEGRPTAGRLELDDVTFSYPGAQEPVLRNISFTLEPGQTTAIVGGTGSGKSTLANLLPRLLDVSSGEVRLDGIDIRDMDLEVLWSAFGIDAMVEQGGANLSGGQRQRLAIARCLVRRPLVYVFDDCFSALDYATESRLRAALRDETRDRTVVIVAQRISTIMHADQIVVLDQGSIAGIGTHEALLETCPTYVEILSSQVSVEELA